MFNVRVRLIQGNGAWHDASAHLPGLLRGETSSIPLCFLWAGRNRAPMAIP